jgi:tellurite resistance protein TerC
MATPLWVWVGFNIFVVAMLGLDLGIMQRRTHEIRIREALQMAGFWIALAIVFNVLVYFWLGTKAAAEFLTGYLIEESLSVDNLFVFLLIFGYFRVPRQYQHKVLFWGIIGAIVLRMGFILAGIALVNRFRWMFLVLGVILIISGVKLFFNKDEDVHPEKNPVLRLARAILPITRNYEGGRFTLRVDGKRMFTPMLIVLLVIETTDIVFAMDSIPAILGITQHAFIVYSSNIFAILGLRAIFFALSGVMQLFHYLHYGLSAILIFVGAKMLAHELFHISIPIGWALGTVAFILGASVVISLLLPKQDEAAPKGGA